ncbi:RNA polymerase II transcription factor B subunit 2 [Fusarium keratoplasticum]|uniref:RNA polymerase II transcription factor B subunit 2 n=1 Tax=Fusarium keratoplasticum TaxID=1328300 RepID=A0ACC0R3N8_9HYPO|nr:RNA polymerase II transcription factor B subunit 2 [Fusarium keratoplasticum]KAI8674713.1 RNA polymerase II transcription factor B subunit 2 [Fusarium keratoplasticum]KAI8681179.1 RNA polymerase II transcription factor B subunit 2 [Fusarium keratoplasticum]
MSVSPAPSLQLAEYLEKLPGTTFRKLYQQPSTAFAIFRRMLPHLAKTFVMRILYSPKPILLTDLDDWVKPSAKRQKDQALSILRVLYIVQITAPSKERPQEMQLTANFKTSLRLALSGGGTHNSFGVPSNLQVPPEIDIIFLDRYARRKWEDILHFVVSSVGYKSTSDVSGPNKSVKELLIAGRLVDRKPNGMVGITQAGFTFLLQEANAQVWTLLLLWLEAMDVNKGAGLEATDMLSFLFVLASMELGRAYDTNALTEQRKNMLPSLVDFGLIYIPNHKRSMFFPTRLATTLTSSGNSLRSISDGVAAATAAALQPGQSGGTGGSTTGSGQEQRGSVIIETNYRIYAYTQSTLQIAVLALFSKLSMRFPDMVAGRLSRQSIRQAINFGITADQIISYLAAHAHDQMHRTAALNNKPVLPPTVVDQIRLWQLENERMKTTSGFLFKDFEDHKEYMAVAGFAEEVGVLVWRNDVKGMFFASKHEQIRDYLRIRKKAE